MSSLQEELILWGGHVFQGRVMSLWRCVIEEMCLCGRCMSLKKMCLSERDVSLQKVCPCWRGRVFAGGMTLWEGCVLNFGGMYFNEGACLLLRCMLFCEEACS